MNKKHVNFSNNSYAETTNIKIEIPYLCPHCQVSNNPTNHFLSYTKANDMIFISLLHRCTACTKSSFTLQTVNNKIGTIQAEYPHSLQKTFDPLLESLSPRFVNLYNQALAAEQRSHYDVAGMGYRASLEILIKDYALDAEMGTQEEVSRLNLNRSIEKYFKDDSQSFISADVVRIIGNEFTHWDRSEEALSLEELKGYLDIFITTILVKQMIKHPPVSRR